MKPERTPSKPVPWSNREAMCKDYHFTDMTDMEIGRKYGISSKTVGRMACEFPPGHFMAQRDRIERVHLIIASKLSEVKENNDYATFERVAEVLSRV